MSLASKGVVSPPHPQGREMLTGCRAPSGQCVCVCVCIPCWGLKLRAVGSEGSGGREEGEGPGMAWILSLALLLSSG